jgi:succinylglutamate desuccinylase
MNLEFILKYNDNEKEKKAKKLQEDYKQFIEKYGLPLISADDLRYKIINECNNNHEHIFPKHNDDIIDYLDRFINDWKELDY